MCVDNCLCRSLLLRNGRREGSVTLQTLASVHAQTAAAIREMEALITELKSFKHSLPPLKLPSSHASMFQMASFGISWMPDIVYAETGAWVRVDTVLTGLVVPCVF